jgi:hypothetical protein
MPGDMIDLAVRAAAQEPQPQPVPMVSARFPVGGTPESPRMVQVTFPADLDDNEALGLVDGFLHAMAEHRQRLVAAAEAAAASPLSRLVLPR